ncbi:MAG TPA: NADP-dependent oxidoreductase [Albitalea sp.]|nr:NADP-dependent oxidoreductase [Albitalea sp.]
MQAIVQHAFGGPQVLELAELPRPRPMAGEVLVRQRATSVNPVDLYVRSGVFALIGQPPLTLGWDVSGIVEEPGPGTSRFAVGDEVFGMPRFPRAANAYAEYVAAPASQLARKPARISHEEAAALPLAGLTAWQALHDVAMLQPGQRVLIHGAGGGVGHLAVQIAKALGAEVTATASAAKHAFVRSLGADRVIDYRTEDFAERLAGLDVVLDLVGHSTAERSLNVLREGGLLVTAVERMNTSLAELASQQGRRFAGVAVEADGTGMARLAELVEAGRLRAHVERVFALSEAAAAHQWLGEVGESNRWMPGRSTQGKLVLRISDASAESAPPPGR